MIYMIVDPYVFRNLNVCTHHNANDNYKITIMIYININITIWQIHNIVRNILEPENMREGRKVKLTM